MFGDGCGFGGQEARGEFEPEVAAGSGHGLQLLHRRARGAAQYGGLGELPCPSRQYGETESGAAGKRGQIAEAGGELKLPPERKRGAGEPGFIQT